MNPALYYYPDAYSTSGPKLMGRNVAGSSFLRGFLAYGRSRAFPLLVEDADHVQLFAAAAQAAGRAEPISTITRHTLPRLAEAGLLYRPDPLIGGFAWQRAAFGHHRWSLCGITHTTSSAGAMDAIVDLLNAPVQPWDALICTSAAVKQNVVHMLDAQAEYLRSRFGATRLPLPELPVIPLGIDCAAFDQGGDARIAARQGLGIAADTIAVLYVGRLSFHAKAHPLAMYQAIARAATASGKRAVLIECGWHGHQAVADAFAAGAALACPDIEVVGVDGLDPVARDRAWAAADVFCSLSDNIQETFGITPIEAMAAGLPVVVSDWDGYRDTVQDGVHGYRIPTTLPRAGLSRDLALRHALGVESYDAYCGNTAMLTAVDIDAAAEAFTRLFASADLRAQFGAAGRDHARRNYDWSMIIPRYEALWSELDTRRQRDGAGQPALRHPWPARMEPLEAFAHYATHSLDEDTVLTLSDADAETAIARFRDYRALAMVRFAAYAIPRDEDIAAILQALAKGAQRAGDLLASTLQPRAVAVLRGLGLLAKLGIVRIVDPI